MNDLRVFQSADFGSVRTVEQDGKVLFCGRDIAAALGYANTQDALAKHCKSDGVAFRYPIQDSMGRTQEARFIAEGDVYRLITHSRLPAAEQFERWVFDEVLPSIRKNGGYIHGPKNMSDSEIMARALLVAQSTIAQRDKRISELTVINQIMRPKADYFDEIVDRNLLTNFRETAKQLGIKERVFIGFLMNHKYVYRDKRGRLMPYAEKNNGLFKVKEAVNEKTQWAGTQTLITPKGRETFRLLCQGIG